MSCTLFPDIIKGVYIGDLCARHDRDYAKQVNKIKADMELYNGIRARGFPFVAAVVLLGISTFGWLFYIRARFR